MKKYTTKHGDTWDQIALEQLGSEYMLPLLLQKNYKHRLVVQFESGIEIDIPTIDYEEISDIPSWLIGEEIEEDTSDDDNSWPTIIG